MARLFTSPGLCGEFTPSSFFTGVDLVWPGVEPVPVEVPLRSVFADAITELCGDAPTVGVSLSGGLDSMAVLVHVLALHPRRQVIAFVADLVDDTGLRVVLLVNRLLAGLDLADRVAVVAVDPACCSIMPPWSPYGPRLDALPAVNATVAQLADERGVAVLLSGDGADELLAAPRFATMSVLRRFGFSGARRYLTDMTASGPGLAGELAAMASLGLPAALRIRLYWAANWPEWSPPAVSTVLAQSRRHAAGAWARTWVECALRSHLAAGHSWAEADAVDAWWPRTYQPPAGSVPEASPFLHGDVVAAALALPLAARYDPTGPSVYHRVKAQVVELFPPHMRRLLPDRKRTYRRALRASVSGPCATPIAANVGLLDPDAITRETDTATRMMVLAVEAWLAGAQVAGISLTGGRSTGGRPR